VASAEQGRLLPLTEPPPQPELALLMGTLQTLTHKLALAADAGNAPLAAFYLHESREQLRSIQLEAPEYESLPIAVLIERMALPAYAELEAASAAHTTRETLLAGLDRIIQSCNACHVATQRPYLKITRGTETNPFNQSFQP
jgi:mono/diheme cytochrome c family protein